MPLGHIFNILDVATPIPDAPSGRFPGGDRDGRIWRLSFVGGAQVLDHVFAIYSRVLCVNIEDLGVISFFFEVLHKLISSDWLMRKWVLQKELRLKAVVSTIQLDRIEVYVQNFELGKNPFTGKTKKNKSPG